ncbi:MAG: non-canonical purine NTP pyrophosphatase [Vampirovibrionales bacterium]
MYAEPPLFKSSLATTNRGKVAEVQTFFNSLTVNPNTLLLTLECLTQLPEVDETATTFLGNARLKALAAAPLITQGIVLAEDSGFSIPALAGTYGHTPFPGVCSNRWMTPTIRRQLLGIEDDSPIVQAHLSAGIYALLQQQHLHPQSTQATYTSAWVAADAHGNVIFETEGVLNLTVVPPQTPAGPYGFGYDPITQPASHEIATLNVPQHHSLSDIPTEIKNQFSHRGKALRALHQWLIQSYTVKR